MKCRAVSVALSLACTLGAAALPRVAVLDIAAQAGIDPSVVVPVTETIMEEVVGARAYVVLDRAYVEQVLKEMEFELSSLVGEAQATKAGQFLGADYVVAGKVQTIGDAYFLVAKMIEVRTGVIVSQSSEQGEGKLSALLGMSRQVGRKLVAGAPVSALAPATKPEAAATAAQPGPAPAPARRVKAGFVLAEWCRDPNHSLSLAIDRLSRKHKDWLDIAVASSDDPAGFAPAVASLVEKQGCQIVFSCVDASPAQCAELAARYPGTIFEIFGGTWDESGPPNLGVFGLNETGIWYLEGLVAGGLSAKGRIGALVEGLDASPWERWRINRLALGARDANPKAQLIVDFRPPDHWADTQGDIAAARSLADQGCDVIVGSIAPKVALAFESLGTKGTRIRTFQDEFSYKFAPAAIISGPLRDYGFFFEKYLLALRDGNWKREAFWALEGSAFGGGEEAFNPAFLSELKSKKVKTPDLGTLPLLELLDKRARQLAAFEFEPFAGPVRDQKGNLRIKEGVRPSWEEIEAIDWLVENVKESAPRK